MQPLTLTDVVFVTSIKVGLVSTPLIEIIDIKKRNRWLKMEILNRSVLMKAHGALAAFILPVAIMFFVTGAFYTWGIKGSYETTVHELKLQKNIREDLPALTTLVTKELKKQNIDAPSGQAKIKKIGNAFMLEWTGSNRDVILEPTEKPLIVKLKIKDTNWYRQFVQLHKAKGGIAFKVYAAVFASALLLILVTGFIMAWQTPKLRKLTLFSASLGVVTFLGMVISS